MQKLSPDIFKPFDQRTLDKGFELHMDGMVLHVQMDESGQQLRGLVKGSARQPYQQVIRLPTPGPKVKPPDTVNLMGLCSCPVNYNCKHVAAVLFEYLDQLEAEQEAAHAGPDNKMDRWLEELNRWLPEPESGEQGGAPGKGPPGKETSSKGASGAAGSRKAVAKTASPPRQKMVYLLDFDTRESSIYLQLEIRPLLKSGEFSTGSRRSFDLSRYLHLDTLPAYIEPADMLILSHLLAGKARQHFFRGYRIEGDFAPATLQLILESGRAFTAADLRGSQMAPVRWGPPASLDLRWHEITPGVYRLTTDTGQVRQTSLNPPLYFDSARGLAGRLELPLERDILSHLLQMPDVEGAQLPVIAKRLQDRIGPVVPVPKQQEIRYIATAPVPVLLLGKAEYRSVLDSRIRSELQSRLREQMAAGEPVSSLASTEQFCYVMPGFAYDDMLVNHAEKSPRLTLWSGDGCVQIQRNPALEAACLAELQTAGLRYLTESEKAIAEQRVKDALAFDLYHKDSPWFELVTKDVPRWKSQGWRIEYTEDFPYENIVLPDANSTWYSNLQPGPEDNSLLLGIGIEVAGERYNLLPCLLELMRRYTQEVLQQMHDSMLLPVTLEGNKKLYLPVDRVRNLLGTLYDLFDSVTPGETSRLRISPHDLALLDDLAMEQHYHESVAKMRLLVDRLRQPSLVTASPIPASFLATLRDYQQEGVTWLQLLREADSGGILADDMGLGKTIQALAHLAIEKVAGRLDLPALLVVPTSLVSNWRAEAARFAPDLRVLILHGSARHDSFIEIARHDLIITTYPLILRDAEHLLPLQFAVLILDEAQTIKNPQARVTQLLHRFKARQRICLTGTPLENHLGELWSQFHFLNPGLLRDQTTFNRLYRNPIEKTGDSYRQRALHARIAPFMLRRTKVEVAAELPSKTEMVRRAIFKPKQRDLYETVRVAMDKKVREVVARKGLTRSHIEILDALLKLRQICCDPALLKLPAAKLVKESAKLELLQELLPELIAEGRRVLIFSQFTSMLARIEDWLHAARIDFVMLTGDTRDRQTPLERFQRCEVPVFLISLKAGGTGLNLTAADTVIHFDPWWNPAVEDQATDRAYRIGQDKPVFVYRLIVENTVEEKMLLMQEKKRALANTVYDNTGKLSYDFSEADLADLFR